MLPRRDALFFALALGLSLALHAGFLLFLPGMRTERARPTQDVVVVDLAEQPPSPRAESPPPEPAARPAPKPEPETEEAAPPAALEPPGPAEPASPAAASPGRPAPAPQSPAAAAAPRSEGTAGASPRGVARAADAQGAPPNAAPAGAPANAARPAPPSLRAFLPTSRDLTSFRNAPGLPDPMGGEAREATLGLGDQDERYRGYQDQVKSAIYGSWRVGKALVVAGGSRTVLVRLTLDATGLVQDVRVVEGSGNPTLDAEAVDAVRRARIPPFPSKWTIERLNLMARFDYLFR